MEKLDKKNTQCPCVSKRLAILFLLFLNENAEHNDKNVFKTRTDQFGDDDVMDNLSI